MPNDLAAFYTFAPLVVFVLFILIPLSIIFRER